MYFHFDPQWLQQLSVTEQNFRLLEALYKIRKCIWAFEHKCRPQAMPGKGGPVRKLGIQWLCPTSLMPWHERALNLSGIWETGGKNHLSSLALLKMNYSYLTFENSHIWKTTEKTFETQFTNTAGKSPCMSNSSLLETTLCWRKNVWKKHIFSLKYTQGKKPRQHSAYAWNPVCWKDECAVLSH